eukprot:2263913-Rhodomonas_salina.4
MSGTDLALVLMSDMLPRALQYYVWVCCYAFTGPEMGYAVMEYAVVLKRSTLVPERPALPSVHHHALSRRALRLRGPNRMSRA